MNKQKMTPAEEYYSSMLALDEKIEKHGLRSEMKDALSRSKTYLLDSLSSIEFKKKIAMNQRALYGQYIHDIEVKGAKTGETEDKIEKEIKQIAKKIKLKQEQIAKVATLFQEVVGSLNIDFVKSGKQLKLNDYKQGLLLNLRDEIDNINGQIKDLIQKYDEKTNEVNDKRQQLSLANTILKASQEKDNIIEKQIRSVQIKLKSKQLVEKSSLLEGNIRQKVNCIERKFTEAELKELRQEKILNTKEVQRLKASLKVGQGQLSKLKRQQQQLSLSISKLKNQVEKLTSKTKQLSQQINDYENKMSALQLQLIQLQYQFSLKSREKAQYHQSENNFSNLETLFTNKQKTVSQLIASYDAVAKTQEAELDELEDQIQTFEKQLKAIDKQISTEISSIDKNKDAIKKNIDSDKAEKFNLLIFNKRSKNEVKKI